MTAHKELKYASFSTLNLTKSLKGLTALPFLPMPPFSLNIVAKYAVEINSTASPATCQI